MKNTASILGLYAVTPCHAGSGASVGVVDLPIQRERHTNWPVIQASGMKGALRAHFDRFKNSITARPDEEAFKKITELIFGSDSRDNDHAGSLTVGDVKILAFPMRSNVAPFVWITCPAVLKRLNQDLALTGRKTIDLANLQELTTDKALWANGLCKEGDRILLEDMEVTATEPCSLGEGTPFFQEAERLLVVHDEVFGYGVSHCTSVMAQIKIDQKTGTTSNGSLRYQEELPADTLMYTILFWGDSRDDKESLKADAIRGYIQDEVVSGHIQIGGDETLGRGIFSLTWF
ncbi:type III-B CRISPR module RAMP protein Cmr4 [Desulfobulbus elongatus]|uniref:type III-B CRISPR module RAMP protein Cmr4 n=1 Tax=Desulfobulbus elongatus TaxID=53332 RepID=UPI00055673AB|nr:type III-B CRISPR module RAMP protein Cmr4 [Desulfobulbus elongatus]